MHIYKNIEPKYGIYRIKANLSYHVDGQHQKSQFDIAMYVSCRGYLVKIVRLRSKQL